MFPSRRTALVSLIGLGASAQAWSSPRPLAAAAPGHMLAMEAAPGMDPRGWLVSEKLDGVRALWDGQRLRFRSGAEIVAPRWFTAALPRRALDGELWLDRGRFDEVSGKLRRIAPDDASWRALRYEVFDLPDEPGPFERRAAVLADLLARQGRPGLAAVPQTPLPDPATLQRRLDEVVAAGGEGLMLHHANALWRPGRSGLLRKLKPQHDAEAVVIGHLPGAGRHVGRLGALRVRTPEGRVFELGTGLSDAERDDPPPVGSTVTYRHRGLTSGGLPRFASFVRVRVQGQ